MGFRKIVLAVTILFGSFAADADQAPVGAIPELTTELSGDEAHIWYLLHCGYAVKTASKLLIFDYIPKRLRAAADTVAPSLAVGRIDPKELQGLDVYVFVSHSHTDHFSPEIFAWRETVPNITYFFGWDESEHPDDHNLIGPRATYRDENVEVYTINSHHSGVPEVAYLVKTDSLWIYHGGDYNSDYKNDIAYLKQFTDKIDIAMMNDWCGSPITEVLTELRPNLALPGHFGGDEASPRKMPDCIQSLGLPIRTESPRHRGARFHYRRTP